MYCENILELETSFPAQNVSFLNFVTSHRRMHQRDGW